MLLYLLTIINWIMVSIYGNFQCIFCYSVLIVITDGSSFCYVSILPVLHVLLISAIELFILQVLSSVLDISPSPFGIRLAALGSRKELVDLEKWLSSNLVTYKDFFFEVTFNCPTSCPLSWVSIII